MTITDPATEGATRWQARRDATAQVLQAVGQSHAALATALEHAAATSRDATRIPGAEAGAYRWGPLVGLHDALDDLGRKLDPGDRDALFRILVATAAATERAAAMLAQEEHPAAREHHQAAVSIRDLARRVHPERSLGLYDL